MPKKTKKKKKQVDQLEQALSAPQKWTQTITCLNFSAWCGGGGAMQQNLPISGSILLL